MRRAGQAASYLFAERRIINDAIHALVFISIAGNLTGALVDAKEIGDTVAPDRRMLASLLGASLRVNDLPKTLPLHDTYPRDILAQCFFPFHKSFD